MRKRKDAVALFELIGKEKLQRAEPAKPAAPAAPQPPPRVTTVPQAPQAMQPSAGQAGWSADPLGLVEPRVLSLTVTTARAIAAGSALVVLLVLAFVLGRATGGGTTQPTADQAAAELEEPSAGIGQPPAEAAAQAPAVASPARREAGKYYLVVQQALGSQPQRDANAIAAWLNARGEPVQAVQTPDGKCYVMSLKGFDSDKSPEALKLVQTIQELGKVYRSEGGQYDFRNPWFNLERAARE